MLKEDITAVTGINDEALSGRGLRVYSVAQRMSWAASRETTRDEDIAYCLMGLFDVNMPLLYGEGGVKAFIRLQEAIIQSSEDHSILAWRNRDDAINFGVPYHPLAPSPACFSIYPSPSPVPCGLGHPALSVVSEGVQINVQLSKLHKEGDRLECTAWLDCTDTSSNYKFAIKLQYFTTSQRYVRFVEHEPSICSAPFDAERRTIIITDHWRSRGSIEYPCTYHLKIEDTLARRGFHLTGIYPETMWIAKSREIRPTSNHIYMARDGKARDLRFGIEFTCELLQIPKIFIVVGHIFTNPYLVILQQDSGSPLAETIRLPPEPAEKDFNGTHRTLLYSRQDKDVVQQEEEMLVFPNGEKVLLVVRLTLPTKFLTEYSIGVSFSPAGLLPRLA